MHHIIVMVIANKYHRQRQHRYHPIPEHARVIVDSAAKGVNSVSKIYHLCVIVMFIAVMTTSLPPSFSDQIFAVFLYPFMLLLAIGNAIGECDNVMNALPCTAGTTRPAHPVSL